MHYVWKCCAMVLIFGLGLFSIADTAYAAIGYVYQNNFVSGHTANGFVETFPAPSLPANCRITSSIGMTINVIGWTWRQCSLLNANMSVIQFQYAGGHAPSGSYTSATFSFGSVPSGTVTYRSEGVHDFNHTGSNPSPWRPYNSATH